MSGAPKVSRWRARDGSLKVTLSGLPSDRAVSGAVTATVRRVASGPGAGLYGATIPTRVGHGAVEANLSLRTCAEGDTAGALERWMLGAVVGAWGDGCAAILGHASELAWARDVRARESAGAPVWRADAAREVRGEAA